ncbi:MAG: cytochrome c [Bryobacterales bacterium]|nr:cytochrome c [Bryobacteraceae bacterium]MDW8129949.1 cytochrome c [Bryobacterales bacterium]
MTEPEKRALAVRVALLLLFGGWPASWGQKLDRGEEIFRSACAACHGWDARGQDRSQVGFEQPLPDFTDCNFATREAAADWVTVVRRGGPARGFSEIMPAFGEALTREQIESVVNYLRGFCAEPSWPRGELNLPRPFFTTKAFPEDETVVTNAIHATGSPALLSHWVYEKRVSARNQVEISLPFRFLNPATGRWRGGVGDLALGYKRVIAHSLNTGSILSASVEAVLPTGDPARGFGGGVTVFEPFLAWGQLFPSEGFLQVQAGFELPTRTRDAPRAAFWRAALGRGFFQQGGDGRYWAPMVEFLADREFETGARVVWDVVPQLHVTLSRRHHIRANVGLRIPANQTAGRPVQVLFYLLWDRFDGGLTEGW